MTFGTGENAVTIEYDRRRGLVCLDSRSDGCWIPIAGFLMAIGVRTADLTTIEANMRWAEPADEAVP